MSSLSIGIVVLVAATLLAVMLARRSARSFLEDKKRKRHRKNIVRLPGSAPHGKRARKR